MKPPNILIRATCVEKFSEQKSLINSIVKPDNYTIYNLNEDKFFKEPWHDACALLLFEYDHSVLSKEEELKMLDTYINNHDGKVLFHGHAEKCHISFIRNNLNIHGNTFPQNCTNFKVDLCKSSDPPSPLHASILKKNLIDIPVDQLVSIISSLGIEVGVTRQDILCTLPAYFYTMDLNIGINEVFNLDSSTPSCISGDKLRINIYKETFQQIEEEEEEKESDDLILNIVCKYPQSSTFNWEVYEKKLKTKTYGRQLVFKNVIQSTQDVFTKLRHGTTKKDGFVVTAAQQTKGRGRGGNQWLSPLGCMMFSMCINIPIQSSLGQRLSCIQHMAVVAFVKSIKDCKGYEKLELNIKWPNDIYIKQTIKIGGVIVNCSSLGNTFNIIIGLGVNISNAEPTSCINNLIREHNEKQGTMLKEFCIEDVLAGTINNVEHLVELFQKQGVERFKEEYYKYWMHNDAKVTLEFENNSQAMVTGVDDFGYLEVELGDGKKMCLQPDGNTFDLMRNMISLKK